MKAMSAVMPDKGKYDTHNSKREYQIQIVVYEFVNLFTDPFEHINFVF